MKLLEIICLIITVVILFIIFLLLLILLLKLYFIGRAAATARKKCDEYAELSCNQSELKISSKSEFSGIIGGWNVSDGELPHMAFVQIMNLGNCSGSLISEYFVLTAAHCVHNAKPDDVLVTLGSVNKNTGIVFEIDEIHVHRDYDNNDERTSYNDIALLNLAKKVEFNWKIRPICLNTDFESISIANLTVSGWGIDASGIAPIHLRMVETYIDGQMLTRCLLTFSRRFASLMICAGHPTKHKNTCQGDSGGPLQITLKDGCPNTYEQIGVTSGGTQRCPLLKYGEHLLALYVKVELHIWWIVDIVWPFE